MTKLSTKNADLTPTEDIRSFQNKVISPGNYKIKIHNVQLRPERDIKFGEKLILTVETEPIGNGFVGFHIDKDDPSKGVYEGQTGQVSMSRWGYKNDSLPSGFEISRDDEIFKAVGILCRETGLNFWWDAQDSKYETVDEILNAFILERPFAGVWFFAIICGREYLSKDNKHINHELYFPRDERVLGKAFSLNPEKVQKYNESLHLERIKAKPETNTSVTTQTASEQPKTSPEPNKPVDISKSETNSAVLSFLNDTSQNHGQVTSPFTDEILNDSDIQKQELTKDQAIIQDSDNCPFLPWEEGYDEWMKNHQGT